MKHTITLFLLMILSMTSFAQDYTPFLKKEYTKGEYKLPYRILYPEKKEKTEKYPLFLFLHGMGKRGIDNESQLSRGASLFLKPENKEKYPCIALYPQAPKTSAFVLIKTPEKKVAGGFSEWSRNAPNYRDAETILSPYGEMVFDVVQDLIAQGLVDTSRIYIAGSSMGGYSTYHFISQFPTFFAAAAPMGSGTNLKVVDKWAGKTPVWIVHGDNDTIVSIDADRAVVAKLKEKGVEYRYSEYKGAKHNSWDKAFEEPDFMEWFFSHSRK